MSRSGKNTLINLRYQDGSEGSASNPVRFNNQDYTQLKNYHLEKDYLFVDSTFPPNSCSLGDVPFLNNYQEDNVEWLRPAELMKRQNNSSEPTFCMEGASRVDFGQGGISNCWLLAAFSSLNFSRDLMVQVVPMNQSFVDYAGIFHFRFWRFGKWVDVVIDDFLPTINNQLISVFNKGGSDFWLPLLAKAYAKVCGSYADMNYGAPSDACKDLTGGVSVIYPLGQTLSADNYDQLWLSLTRATGCVSMICCLKGDSLGNTSNLNGLLEGYAYSVTAVTEIEHLGSKVKLVRLFNPWGEQEWTGNWSDKSTMWDSVSPDDQKKRFNCNDGEFWMPLEEFCQNFVTMTISCENPNFIEDDATCQWKCMSYDGSWVAGRSAGGSMNEISFESNPQYRIQVTTIDEKEPGDKNVILSLIQKPVANRMKSRFYPIGLNIVKVPPGTPEGWLELPFFYENSSVKAFDFYVCERELVEMHSLEPGEYVIIPFTSKPYMAADFLLTVYTKAEVKISVNEKHLEQKKVQTKVNSVDKDPCTCTLFKRFADQNNELDSTQLQKLLNENFPHGSTDGFSLDVCRSMSALVDTDYKMTTTITEFWALWEKMHEYKRIFEIYDLNLNGALSNYELQKAVEETGIDMESTTVNRLIARYSDHSATSLRNFVVLMIRLEKTSNVFKNKAKDGKIEMTWEEWSNNNMYS